MKTSLVIDDNVFKEAKREAAESGRTISEIISLWARLGREEWASRSRAKTKPFQPVDLGEPTVDLSSRRNWQEELEEDPKARLKTRLLRAAESDDDDRR
jgi:hypothetical protein